MDTPTTTISLAELAAPTSCGASLATRSLSEVFAAEAEGRDPLAPSPEDIATLTTQYRKAVNGLYEAYLFGQMLAQVKARLEGAAHPLDPAEAQGASPHSPCSVTRDTARRIIGNNGNEMVCAGGWNAGTGLKAWLAQHCPEINYSTARRFLAVAEKTNAALAESEAVPASPRAGVTPAAGEGARSPFPSETPFLLTFPEETIRAFLEGKSQRQVLTKAPAVPVKRRATTPEELSEKVYETMDGFLGRLEGMERSYETNLLSQESRRELVTRLKGLARRLEEAGR